MRKTAIAALFLAIHFLAGAQAIIYSGRVESITAGESITAPAVVYVSTVDGKAYKASSSTTTNKASGVIYADVSADASTNIAYSGVISWSSLATGSTYYLSTTAGAITSTAPSNVQVVGRAVSSDRFEIAFGDFTPTSWSTDAELSALAGVVSGSGKLPYFTGSGTADVTDLTSAGRALISGADAAAQRATLGVSSGDVSTDAIWDSSGDIVVGTGSNTAARLAKGTALQQLRIAADGSTLEYFTPSAGSGDISDGGNTTGAAVKIGTNDANRLELETNNVTRIGITGGASTGGAVTMTDVTANTNAVENVLALSSSSTGTAAANFGTGILFQGESSTTDNQDMVRLSSIWTTATHASRTSALVYSDVTGAGALTERFRFQQGNITTATQCVFGNSSSKITIGGSSGEAVLGGSSGVATVGNGSGTVGIATSSTSSQAISLYCSSNTSSTTAGINLGASLSFTQTSGTRNYISADFSFAPTSGTAVHNKFNFSGTLNQTGGASGIVRGINFAHTVTNVADYRAIEIADNHANAKGIYQSGASTTNRFVGGTTFGATSAPNAAAAIDVTSTTKGVLFPRMTGTQRDAISSPPDGLVIFNTTDTKLQVRAGGVWVDLH